jgi:hypothetical protein
MVIHAFSFYIKHGKIYYSILYSMEEIKLAKRRPVNERILLF